MHRTISCLLWLILALPGLAISAPYSYDNPAPLPPIDPAQRVSVSTVDQLINAVNNLQSGKTIALAPGTYNLSGKVDALYLPQGITNWAVRGSSGNRSDVIIKGGGMNGSVRFGIWIGNSSQGTIADLTIDGVSDHTIIANPGANNILYHNLHLIDSGDQFIKSNPDGNGVGNINGIVEYSIMEYRTTDTDNYSNGVDVHGGDGWIVRYNLFKNHLSPPGSGLAGPAILMWNNTKNTLVEGNSFIDCARGVALGLIDKVGAFDHQGGVVKNNFFYRRANISSSVDVPFASTDAPGAKFYFNTIIASGSYYASIENRFASSTGVEMRGNLTDGQIVNRDGAQSTISGNLTNATSNLFVNASAANLHLVAGASVINQGQSVNGLTNDIDGEARDGQPDIGADEYKSNIDNLRPSPPTNLRIIQN